MLIELYIKKYQQQVVDLILNIQQNEFKVPVTLNDQPDLLDIENFYRKKNGDFWIALEEESVIGTIALIDFDNSQSCLRKMFVHTDHRGKEKGIGQKLLDTVVNWCRQKDIKEIYLGTVLQLIAAQKFYIKNGFAEIEKDQLPDNFPLMQVDTMFFKLIL